MLNSKAFMFELWSQIDDIVSGITTVGHANKADTLKCTINNVVSYKNGEYFLDYGNLLNKVKVINDLTHNT